MKTCPHTGLPISLRKRPHDPPGVEWYSDLYSVVIDGVVVGDISRTFPRPNGDNWLWGITMMLQPGRSDVNGSASSMEEAKRFWFDKWCQVNPDLERERTYTDDRRPRFRAEYLCEGRCYRTDAFPAKDGTEALGIAIKFRWECADELRLLDDKGKEIVRMLVKPGAVSGARQ